MIPRMLLVLAAGVLVCTSCGDKKAAESEKAPPPVSGGDAGALTTDITAGDIEKAAEDAKKGIDTSNADAELDKLESEIDDGK